MQEHADFCLKHGTNCVVNRPRTDLNLCNRPQGIFSGSLIVGNAGNCCQGWSAEGKRARKAHSSQHAWNSWLAQRRELALRSEEDMSFQECTELWDVEGCLVKPLEDSHTVVHTTVGPSTLGWPTSRNRLLSAGLSSNSLVWLGPTGADAVKQDFEAVFARSCMLTGSVFCQEDDAERAEWYERKLKQKCFFGSKLPEGEKLMRKILTPGQLQRLEAYGKLRPEHQALDGTFICDLDHWPNSPGPDFGPMFPVLLRHGTILDMNTGKFAMNLDRFLALGFQMSKTLNHRFEWPLARYVLSASDRELQGLTGNCQSVPAILAWQLYVFCNTARLEPRYVTRQPSPSESQDGDEEEGSA